MSNPPRQGGTPEVPVKNSGSRPQAPSSAGPPPTRTPGQTAPGASSAPGPGQPPQPPPHSAAGTQRQPIQPRGIPPRTTGSHGRLPAAQQRQPIDLATRLDGQRGWLAQIDRSLKKRSVIALILTCLAVGVGAAALYISLSKNADSDRIDALQTRIEALEAASGIPSTSVPEAESPIPDTGVTLPDTGVTLPDGTTLPSTGTTDGSGLVIPSG